MRPSTNVAPRTALAVGYVRPETKRPPRKGVCISVKLAWARWAGMEELEFSSCDISSDGGQSQIGGSVTHCS